MTWFATSAFSFELPGDAWEERTLNMFRPENDERTMFLVGRSKVPEGGPVSVEDILKAMPMGPYDVREVVRHEWRQIGPLDAEDVSVFARQGATGEYYRFVTVNYYDLELTFQFAGPVADREDVDRRAERTLESVRFRKR
jgi:hypothetical protein